MISTGSASGSSRSRMFRRNGGTRISHPLNSAGKESIRKPSSWQAKPPRDESSEALLHPQRPKHTLIRHHFPILLRHHAKRSRVVPHRPANLVVLECGAHIVQPRRPVLRIGIVPIHAKLVAHKRHPAPPRPLRR